MRIIVVDDGSTDDTFGLLQRHLGLTETTVALHPTPLQEGEILSAWSTDFGDVVVLRKVSTGRRGDAINAGLRAADQDLVCMIDADSILERDALLHVVEPLLADASVVGVGGVIRPANGAVIIDGAVTALEAPRTWVERIQTLEYLRAFLIGRVGWSAINGLPVISGAFGLFRRDAVMAVGGLDHRTLAEDADLVLALRRHGYRNGLDWRIEFVPTPVCWTEVPSTTSALGRQRTRWSQGLGELLHKYRGMVGNPRYGALGVLTLPYFLLFEYLSPIIGFLGLSVMFVAAAIGMTPWSLFWLLVAASVGLGFITSALAILMEESSFHRFSRTRDVFLLLATALLEPVWFHPLHDWWRLKGLVRAARGTPSEWGVQQRQGIQQTRGASTAGARPGD